MAVPVKAARQQTTPKPSETLELSAGTNRNPPEPSELASGTYTSTHRNPLEPSGTCLRNLHHHTRNLPPEPTPAHTGTLRNLPEPTSGTYTSTGTLRNLPEPSSGTCSCDPHRHTPELIWAEDPISLRCWGKKKYNRNSLPNIQGLATTPHVPRLTFQLLFGHDTMPFRALPLHVSLKLSLLLLQSCPTLEAVGDSAPTKEICIYIYILYIYIYIYLFTI